MRVHRSNRDGAQVVPSFPTRNQLVAAFSALLALFVMALAVGVGQLLRTGIRDAALAGAEQTGRVFSQLEMGPEEYRNGRLTRTARGDLDTAVRTSSTLQAARVWGQDLELIHQSGAEPPTRAIRDPQALQAALGGETRSVAPGSTEAAGGAREAGALAIYVPIALPSDAEPRNVLELDLPYGPVQAEIDDRTVSLALGLGSGAILFYLALLPTVLRGSKALADMYAARQSRLQHRVRQAIRDGELTLAYQPKLDFRSESIVGVEALLRWRLPDGTAVPPGDFVPLIEPTDVMGELTMHVVDMALRQSAAWRAVGMNLGVAVNISASNLRDEELPARLLQQAAAHGLAPQALTLEITEGAMSGSPEPSMRTLALLEAHGFRLSIDDFGTGESSLSRIHEVDFQELKIDRSFVRGLDERRDEVVIRGIIELGRGLGATIVAEGVESPAVAARLEELGCDVIQGFCLTRPLPAGALVEWVEAFRAARFPRRGLADRLSRHPARPAGGPSRRGPRPREASPTRR